MNARDEKLLLFSLLLNASVKSKSIEFWRIFDNDQIAVTKAQNDLTSEIKKLRHELFG